MTLYLPTPPPAACRVLFDWPLTTLNKIKIITCFRGPQFMINTVINYSTTSFLMLVSEHNFVYFHFSHKFNLFGVDLVHENVSLVFFTDSAESIPLSVKIQLVSSHLNSCAFALCNRVDDSLKTSFTF